MFVRGPKAYRVPRARFPEVLAYVHNNPVRAGVTSRPHYSDWTSHRAYLPSGSAPSWLDVNLGLEWAGVPASRLDAMVRGHYVPSLKTEWEQFDELELEEAIVPPEPLLIVDPSVLVSTVADVVGLSVEALRSLRKTPDHVLARNAVVHCGDQLGLRGASMARALGVTQQSVSKILTRPMLRDPTEVVAAVMTRLRKAR